MKKLDGHVELPEIGVGREATMRVVLAIVCATAVAFYVRFLVALCKESRDTRICYLLRLEATSEEESAMDTMREETVCERAA
jgi:hypothetical protein